jgi:predicted nucleic acid-binding protein
LLVVFDADVLIAGTLARSGACREILDSWLRGDFEVVACPQLLWEVEKALKHPRIAGRYRLQVADIDSWIHRLRSEVVLRDDPARRLGEAALGTVKW